MGIFTDWPKKMNRFILLFAIFLCACRDQNEDHEESPTTRERAPLTEIGDSRPVGNPHFLPVTKLNYAQIDKTVASNPKPYTESLTFEKDTVSFEMIPIPGGEFLMGSPDSETGRKPDEGPQHKVIVDPFWMAKTETTWNLYHRYMEHGTARNLDGTLDTDNDFHASDDPFGKSSKLIDAIAQPTPPYIFVHMKVGDNSTYKSDYPAVSMTQHAASKFCEWLTAKTGRYYRLPTEAEWEYACRAGTTTAYSFGDDLAELDDHAWHFKNSKSHYHKVGLKMPNLFGLHDMHGNVAEWTLDAYQVDYQNHSDGTSNPLALSKSRYPRVVRGGHWDADSEELRSAARLPSTAEWKSYDPMNPRSIWHLAIAYHVGFRIVRPGNVPSLEEVHLLWNTGPGEPVSE